MPFGVMRRSRFFESTMPAGATIDTASASFREQAIALPAHLPAGCRVMFRWPDTEARPCRSGSRKSRPSHP